MGEHLSSLSPIEQRTLADIVTSRIREAIIQGRLLPGERLTEPLLADSLKVSRSPVREALARLKSEGLVVGAAASYVWKPNRRDVDEIFTLRTAFECLAAEWIVKRNKLRKKDIAYLQSLVDELKQALEDPARLASISLIDSDEKFHGYICRRSGHSRLSRYWRRTFSQRRILMHCCIRRRSRADIAENMVLGHQFILDKLQSGDLEAIRQRHRTVNERRARQIKEALVESCRIPNRSRKEIEQNLGRSG
ncbi:MAG: GntR family transcriptional regulator [Anaerolineae bacterium]